jgi:hypothetical protein
VDYYVEVPQNSSYENDLSLTSVFKIHMQRLRPIPLITVGILIFLGGFLYDVLFAGIPYQDPTPELSAAYRYHARIASVLCWAGLSVFGLGLVAAITQFVRHSRAKKRQTPHTH